MTSIDAILLAGGEASRMDGADKVMLELAGRRLLERAIDAAHAAGCAHIAVVGPERELAVSAAVEFEWAREDPPFSGPVAGLAAARDLGAGDWVLMLATDVPAIAEVVELLVAAVRAEPSAPAHIIRAADDHLEWLSSAMRRDVFERQVAAQPHLQVGVRRLFADIEPVVHADPAAITDDVDTPEQWAAAQSRWNA